jgi:hypothetical protein
MKQLLLGAALIACAVACKSSTNTSVTDPHSANMPNKECSACPGTKGECSGKTECTGQKADCCDKAKKPQG